MFLSNFTSNSFNLKGKLFIDLNLIIEYFDNKKTEIYLNLYKLNTLTAFCQYFYVLNYFIKAIAITTIPSTTL